MDGCTRVWDYWPFGYVQIRLAGYSGIFVLQQKRGQKGDFALFLRHSQTCLVDFVFGVKTA
eukprot:5978827-Pleurochrysis_carterae.AAC.1